MRGTRNAARGVDPTPRAQRGLTILVTARVASAAASSTVPTAVGVDVNVILTPPCIFCIENHE